MKQIKIDDVISRREQKQILTVCAANRVEKKREINKAWKINRLEIRFSLRDPKSF